LEIFCLLRPEERKREREKNFFSLFTFNILTHNFFLQTGTTKIFKSVQENI
jgi:hypothetical protein